MLSIPFYQKEWLGVDLLQIAKEISFPSNQVANYSFYNAFYKELQKNSIFPNDIWIDNKTFLAKQIQKLLVKYSNVNNLSILSVGSGFGIIELELKKHGFNIDLQECQKYSLNHLKDRKDIKIIISNDLSEIKTGSYDMVLAVTSTYCLNINSLRQFLVMISRILKNNGIFIWYETSLTYSYILQYIKIFIYKKLKNKNNGVLWGWKRSVSVQETNAAISNMFLLEKIYFDNNNNVINPKTLFGVPFNSAVWQLGIYKNVKPGSSRNTCDKS